MQQADVVRRFLLPPHKNAAVAVQPGVNPLNDPTACAMSALALRLFLTAGADVWRVTPATGRAANGLGVITFVAAEMLLASAIRSRTPNRNTIERGFNKPLIMHISTGHRHANRHAATISQHRPLHAEFATIRRVFPGFFPPSGALVCAPSRLCHRQAMPRRPS